MFGGNAAMCWLFCTFAARNPRTCTRTWHVHAAYMNSTKRMTPLASDVECLANRSSGGGGDAGLSAGWAHDETSYLLGMGWHGGTSDGP